VDLHVGTLAVGKDFSLYQRELGLADAATGCWESPFDYAAQALLYVPRDLPQPNSREHTEAVVAARCPCSARAAAARSCCSRRCARSTSRASCWPSARARRARLAAARAGRRLAQRAPARFRELGNAILLGSASFREGVDVPGGAVRRHLDKLPFAPPDDPLLAARLELCAPRAAIRSSTISCRRRHRAEAGRRPPDPHGDRSRRADDLRPALTDKPYGRRIWQSLPPMRRTRELKDVEAFFRDGA
jgi:ATP-dependent DNA helicase DinG